MTLIWILPLLLITVFGMAFLILYERPRTLQANFNFISMACVTSSALFAIARNQCPPGEIVLMYWVVAGVVVMKTHKLLLRCRHI